MATIAIFRGAPCTCAQSPGDPPTQRTHLTFAACSSSHSSRAQPFPWSQAHLSTRSQHSVLSLVSTPRPPSMPPAVLMLPSSPSSGSARGPQCSPDILPTSCVVLSTTAVFLFIHSRLGCSCSQRGITLVLHSEGAQHASMHVFEAQDRLLSWPRESAILMSSPVGLLYHSCIYVVFQYRLI